MSRYGKERHSGGLDGNNDINTRTARRSPSPAHKRRAVAADYFEDDNAQYRKHTHTHHHRHHRDRDARGEGGHREHKRRRHHHDSSSSRRHNKTIAAPVPAELPFKARQLSYKHDLDAFALLFANYLDIQKGKDFYGLDSHEQKGRWKSFVNKWNGGELAEGWYDPEMFERIVKEAPERHDVLPRDIFVAGTARRSQEVDSIDDAQEELPQSPELNDNGEDEDEDDYGPPPPPGTNPALSNSRKGPGIPSLTDLALQREAAAEAHAARTADLRFARKADRKQQKEALDELVPRAEPGTRERNLEKKAAVNEKMRSFREKGDAVEEVDDGDLMGGGDGVAEFKRAVASQQRKKTERELRREEEARARREEREEKLKEWREREEEKMRDLKELAKARFG